MYAFWSGYFYGNYSMTPTVSPAVKAGIAPYGYYNMQGTIYGFNRNHLLCANYGYSSAYVTGLDRAATPLA